MKRHENMKFEERKADYPAMAAFFSAVTVIFD